jgi:hypothetical protein
MSHYITIPRAPQLGFRFSVSCFRFCFMSWCHVPEIYYIIPGPLNPPSPDERGLGGGGIKSYRRGLIAPPPQPSPIQGEGVKDLDFCNINLGRHTSWAQ